MKVIFGAGRHAFSGLDTATAVAMSGFEVSEVIASGAAVERADDYARAYDVPLTLYPASFTVRSKAEAMVDYGEAVILFDGGDGSSTLRTLALMRGLPVFVWIG